MPVLNIKCIYSPPFRGVQFVWWFHSRCQRKTKYFSSRTRYQGWSVIIPYLPHRK